MAFTVKIQFDGLFVFVRRPKATPPVLVVLMANTKEHQPSHGQHGEHPVHEGWVQVGNDPRWAFAGHLDLAAIGLTGGNAAIECALPLTSTTGEHVEEKFLTGDFAKVNKKLEGRIVLPLPKSTRAITEVEVEWEKSKDVWEPLPLPMSGHIELEYEATGSVSIAGTAIKKETTVVFTYLPPNPTIVYHPPKTPLKHSHMHSPIFKDRAPSFRTTREFNPPPAQGEKAKAAFGGDPVVCTSGNGCPPEDITCGGG